MPKVKTYITRIPGVKMSWKSRAFTKDGALKQVWANIRGGYRYGIDSFAELKRKARVEQV